MLGGHGCLVSPSREVGSSDFRSDWSVLHHFSLTFTEKYMHASIRKGTKVHIINLLKFRLDKSGLGQHIKVRALQVWVVFRQLFYGEAGIYMKPCSRERCPDGTPDTVGALCAYSEVQRID